MNQAMQTQPSPMDMHGMYLIRVQGPLDATWLDYFAGISIVVLLIPGISCISTLCTHDADQAMLMGILNSLYNSQFPILSLEQIGSPVA
jgi:hypothetical protein